MVTAYKTVRDETRSTIVIKKSKFIGIVKPVSSEEDIAEFVQRIKKEFYDARHHCVASIIGIEQSFEKANDDGEPAGTAGKPMLEVLRGEGLTNVCVVVVRYFGGTKLGTGGLIKAYTESTQETIQEVDIDHYQLCEQFEIKVDYAMLSKVEYELRKAGQAIVDSIYDEMVTLIVHVEVEKREMIHKLLTEITSGQGEIHLKGKTFVMN